MSDDMTPAQARRALSNLTHEYDNTLLYGVATGQNDASRIPDPGDRSTFRDVMSVLDTEEIQRKTIGPVAEDARGIEETTEGSRSLDDAARRGPFPVEFAVSIVGQPGSRQIDLESQERSISRVQDQTVRDTLSQRFGGDPVESFVEAVGERVRAAIGGELDGSDITGEVGTVRIRSDGTFTFERDLPTTGGFVRGSGGGRRPGDTRPTTQRPERGQQTLSEAGTVEGLDQFAEGTVDDDPDRVIGPADEVRRAHRAATSGAERTAGRGEGLGQFARIEGEIRATLHQDPPTQVPDEDGNVVERPGARTVSPWIVFPDGHSAEYSLRSDVESAIYQAADVDAMFDAHDADTTFTIGTVTFINGGSSVESIDMNDNWYGDRVTPRQVDGVTR